MPTLTATADTAKSQVRLDLDFSDIDAPYALVQRIDAVTGAPTTVRGHGSSVTVGGVAYAPMQAGYKAVLYDTEAPLDTAFYYTATAPAAALNVNQTFADGYTDPWTASVPASMTIRAVSNTSGADFLTFFTAGGVANPQIQAEEVPVTPGATLTLNLTASISSANGVTAGINFRDASGTILSNPNTAAIPTTSTLFTVSAAAPANAVSAQPYIYMQGTPGAGVTVSISSVYLMGGAGTAQSFGVHLPAASVCQLKDPLRPGNNVRVDFVFDPNPLCVPAEGIFWQSLDAESYAGNAAVFNINNQVNPLVVSKNRSAPTSTLTLVSRTFADRDRLLTLLAPGSPLLFQAPDEYGLPDRYMSVSAATVTRVLPDHRIPIRVVSLPHAVCAAPGGPMQGTVGARWSDLCNRYATWAAITTAGLTWTQLLDGAAG